MTTSGKFDCKSLSDSPLPSPASLPELSGSGWKGFAASVPGGGHIRRGIPCQDASFAQTGPRPALIVCDGRGSASLSHFGAGEAVEAFRRQIAILEPFLVKILDCEEEKQDQWIKFCRIMYRTLLQVQYDLAASHNLSEKEFDFTVAFAIAGNCHIGCFQVGDGAIVLRQQGICRTAFLPDKGEFANQTHFLRNGGENLMKFHQALFSAAENSGIAITSDGPEHLMFHLADMTPGKIFSCFFDDLHQDILCRQDIMDYLTRTEWAADPRGMDDRSIALLVNTAAPEADRISPVPACPEEPVQSEKTASEQVVLSNNLESPSPDVPGSEKTIQQTGPVTAPQDEPAEKTSSTENSHPDTCSNMLLAPDYFNQRKKPHILKSVFLGLVLMTPGLLNLYWTQKRTTGNEQIRVESLLRMQETAVRRLQCRHADLIRLEQENQQMAARLQDRNRQLQRQMKIIAELQQEKTIRTLPPQRPATQERTDQP